MSSIEFVKTLFEMGAFAPLYRNDLDVDIAKVHYYVHNKQDVGNYFENLHTLIQCNDGIRSMINKELLTVMINQHRLANHKKHAYR